MAKKKIFIDMDGVLARFYENPDCLERYHDKGFFVNLRAYENMLGAVRILEDDDDISTYILSTADTDSIVAEKKQWLEARALTAKSFFPQDSRKAEFVIERFGEFGDTFVLIDDYSRNLQEWKSFGGTAIKALNELNGRGFNGHHFDGPCLDLMSSKEEIAQNIKNIIKEEK